MVEANEGTALENNNTHDKRSDKRLRALSLAAVWVWDIICGRRR